MFMSSPSSARSHPNGSTTPTFWRQHWIIFCGCTVRLFLLLLERILDPGWRGNSYLRQALKIPSRIFWRQLLLLRRCVSFLHITTDVWRGACKYQSEEIWTSSLHETNVWARPSGGLKIIAHAAQRKTSRQLPSRARYYVCRTHASSVWKVLFSQWHWICRWQCSGFDHKWIHHIRDWSTVTEESERNALDFEILESSPSNEINTSTDLNHRCATRMEEKCSRH